MFHCPQNAALTHTPLAHAALEWKIKCFFPAATTGGNIILPGGFRSVSPIIRHYVETTHTHIHAKAYNNIFLYALLRSLWICTTY